MIVDCYTSTLLKLARTGRLELLLLVYRQVIIASAVYEELTVSKRGLPPAIDLAAAPDLGQERREDLDPGEAEAIVLAIERRAATAAGVTVAGLPCVVAGAKKAGLIDPAKPVLDDLIQIARAGYVLDSGGYGLAAFRGADALALASGSGTKASPAVQGDRPTERLSEQLAESSTYPNCPILDWPGSLRRSSRATERSVTKHLLLHSPAPRTDYDWTLIQADYCAQLMRIP